MLEIGKYYQQRNGVVVGPLTKYTGRLNEDGFAFCCNAEGISNRVWREDGSFSLNVDDKSHCDIVSSVQFTPLQDLTVQLTQQPKEEIVSKFKIEVGKYYKDRDGDIHGPIQSYDHFMYCFVSSKNSSITWTESGEYYSEEENGYDLIEEVPNPYEIKPEEIVKIDDSHNRPTIEEVLSAIQRGDMVTAEDEEGNRYNIYSNNPISLLLDAKSFDFKAKQPVVKYKYYYQYIDSDSTFLTNERYENDDDFLETVDHSLAFFGSIQSTRKEF